MRTREKEGRGRQQVEETVLAAVSFAETEIVVVVFVAVLCQRRS